mmetsp:Transcript_92298/g.265573  ORF Transcript_92298/g.265573 Transcript_92298/m.265573 type:complete len:239 (-) Transcript_92298:250-966(-)
MPIKSSSQMKRLNTNARCFNPLGNCSVKVFSPPGVARCPFLLFTRKLNLKSTLSSSKPRGRPWNNPNNDAPVKEGMRRMVRRNFFKFSGSLQSPPSSTKSWLCHFDMLRLNSCKPLGMAPKTSFATDGPLLPTALRSRDVTPGGKDVKKLRKVSPFPKKLSMLTANLFKEGFSLRPRFVRSRCFPMHLLTSKSMSSRVLGSAKLRGNLCPPANMGSLADTTFRSRGNHCSHSVTNSSL